MQIKTIRSQQELEYIRSRWEELQNHPNNDFAQYQIVCRLRKDFVSPHVSIVERDSDKCTLLIARIERTSFSPSIGYFKPIRISIKSLMILYQGLLGNADEEICQQLISHLQSFLKSKQVDVVTFHLLPEDSPLLKVLKVDCSRRWCEETAKWTAHWTMKLPEQPGFLLKNMRSKHRSWINSRQKKLESAYPGKVSWQWISSFDDIAEITARLEVVAASTYQRGLGAGFVDDEEHRQRYRLFADRGQLRVQLVGIEGKVKAFWIGIVYKGVFHSSATSYDPDFRSYELGSLMFIAMTDELVREGVFKIDFGLGDAFYKERFGDQNWRETTVHLFAPNFKGILLRSTLSASTCIDNILRRILQKTGLLGRVKTGLRRLVQRRSKTDLT
ncbi:MAG: GNAT family N-acetyltransferase [Smithella sp.]